MTRHKHAHTGLVTPQLPQHWLTAALRAFAMLVQNVASTLQMICRRRPVIGTQAMPSALPKAKTDAQHQEPNLAVQPDSLPIALILRDRMHEVRTAELPHAIVSKDQRVLTNASHKLLQHREPHKPAPPYLRSSRRKSRSRAPRVMFATGLHTQPWIPTCVGTSGDLIIATNKNATA